MLTRFRASTKIMVAIRNHSGGQRWEKRILGRPARTSSKARANLEVRMLSA